MAGFCVSYGISSLGSTSERRKLERNGEDSAELLLNVKEEMEEAEATIQRRFELAAISGFELHTARFFSLYHFTQIEKFALVLAGVVGMKNAHSHFCRC